jgi:cyclopropane fatty-acyl-phospholipid synthase-like methyltransferase
MILAISYDNEVVREGIKALLEEVGIKKGDTVLDFGCGVGYYTIPAAQIVGEGGEVYALDKDSDALSELMKTAESEGLENIKPINTLGVFEISLDANSVDVVLLYDIIHLIGWGETEGKTTRISGVADRKPFFKEVHSVTRLNARVSVYPPHLDTHTDVNSEEDVIKELEAAGFNLDTEFYRDLLHDNNLVRGHILNFRKNGG